MGYLALRCLMWAGVVAFALGQLRLPSGDVAQAGIALTCAAFLLGRDLGLVFGGQS